MLSEGSTQAQTQNSVSEEECVREEEKSKQRPVLDRSVLPHHATPIGVTLTGHVSGFLADSVFRPPGASRPGPTGALGVVLDDFGVPASKSSDKRQ